MNTLTIPAFSAEAAEAAQRRLDNLAKVPRSLGRLEELAVRLAGITGKECPVFPEKSVVLFAADHDIALQGVSATGQEGRRHDKRLLPQCRSAAFRRGRGREERPRRCGGAYAPQGHARGPRLQRRPGHDP